jgi:hypothetical protein
MRSVFSDVGNKVLLAPLRGLRLRGVEDRRPLTRTEEEESIIINRPDRIHLSRTEICLKKRSHPRLC